MYAPALRIHARHELPSRIHSKEWFDLGWSSLSSNTSLALLALSMFETANPLAARIPGDGAPLTTIDR